MVNSVDALHILREVAGMGAAPACTEQGDVNCDGGRSSVDALGILRYVVQLPSIPQAAGCPPIGPFLEIEMGDDFFLPDEALVAAGTIFTFDLTNAGHSVHNMRIAGPDGQYMTADDAVSNPEVINAGGTGRLIWAAPQTRGAYPFRCDFHPNEQTGTITVE
jgi:plastocyanin